MQNKGKKTTAQIQKAVEVRWTGWGPRKGHDCLVHAPEI